jgi:hypothetical protein
MKYKVGDRVRIVSKRVDGMNREGEMDKFLGKTMTIRELVSICTVTFYKMLEDKNENLFSIGWNWTDDMIAGLADEREFIVLYRNGNTINATYKVGDKIIKKSNARCNPSDKFDFNKGAQLAFNRLLYGTDYHPSETKFHVSSIYKGRKLDAYNGKVVCVSSNHEQWTKGRVYTIKDCLMIDNNRRAHIIVSFEHLCEYSRFATWLEIVE